MADPTPMEALRLMRALWTRLPDGVINLSGTGDERAALDAADAVMRPPTPDELAARGMSGDDEPCPRCEGRGYVYWLAPAAAAPAPVAGGVFGLGTCESPGHATHGPHYWQDLTCTRHGAGGGK